MRRSLPQLTTVFATAALLAVILAGAASAQIVGSAPSGGTMAVRSGTPEGGALSTATTSPRAIAATRAAWLTLPRWSELSLVRVTWARPDWAAIRRRLVAR